MNYGSVQKTVLAFLALLAVLLLYIVFMDHEQNSRIKAALNVLTYGKVTPETLEATPTDPSAHRYIKQRNELSVSLNNILRSYGQKSCEEMKLRNKTGEKVEVRISEHGGWCAETSAPNSTSHMFDEKLSIELSKFFKGKTVGSFGDGPGAYKKHMDSLGEVKSYTAYDGAPYCEKTTNGRVIFLDLSVPHYGLPIYDWAISLEVGEHIPAKYEDIYLDNLVRHTREGLILSWAVPGQGGLSHVNNKALSDVIAQMQKRGFDINKEESTKLQNSATLPWLQKNTNVYYRISPNSLVETDA